MYVVLDSSVIIEKDWHLTSPPMLVLRDASRRGGVHLALPELVIREVLTKHAERERDTLSKLENTRRSLIHIQAGFSSDDRLLVEPISERWAADFRERLHETLVEILPLDSASHDELVGRALARRRPFDGEGRVGYRDALIWHAVMRLAQKDDVVLVSDDGHFAGDSGALHPQLRDDLTAAGLPDGRVRLFQKVEETVRELFAPADELLAHLNERIEADGHFQELLVDELREASHYGYGRVLELDIDLESDADSYSRWIKDFELEDLTRFKDLCVLRAYPAGGDMYSVEVTVLAEARFRVEISTEGWYDRPPRTDFDLSSDERSFYATGFADVSLEYWSRYSRAKEEFEEHELVGIHNA